VVNTFNGSTIDPWRSQGRSGQPTAPAKPSPAKPAQQPSSGPRPPSPGPDGRTSLPVRSQPRIGARPGGGCFVGDTEVLLAEFPDGVADASRSPAQGGEDAAGWQQVEWLAAALALLIGVGGECMRWRPSFGRTRRGRSLERPQIGTPTR